MLPEENRDLTRLATDLMAAATPPSPHSPALWLGRGGKTYGSVRWQHQRAHAPDDLGEHSKNGMAVPWSSAAITQTSPTRTPTYSHHTRRRDSNQSSTTFGLTDETSIAGSTRGRVDLPEALSVRPKASWPARQSVS